MFAHEEQPPCQIHHVPVCPSVVSHVVQAASHVRVAVVTAEGIWIHSVERERERKASQGPGRHQTHEREPSNVPEVMHPFLIHRVPDANAPIPRLGQRV